eukprot:30928-Pelagococcus_subviridis.AAC.10
MRTVVDVRPIAHERGRERDGVEDARGEGVEEKKDEVLVVVRADARRDPDAVVIHLQHASPAHGAVVRSLRLPRRALAAEPPALLAVGGSNAFVLLVLGRGRPTRRDATGIGEHAREVAPQRHDDQDVVDREDDPRASSVVVVVAII